MGSMETIHPGIWLRETYIDSSGISIFEWSRRSGIDLRAFKKIINGRQSLNARLAFKLSNAFPDSPESLVRRQNRFDLENYYQVTDSRPSDLARSFVLKSKENQLIKDELIIKFMRPNNTTFNELARHLGLNERHLHLYFGYVETRFDFTLLGRIGQAVGIDLKYLLALRTRQDAEKLIKQRPCLKTYLDEFINSEDETIIEEAERCWAPGEFLYNNYLKPSGIKLLCWADFFCMGTRSLKRIIDGKKEMDIRFMYLLKKAFNTSISFWVNLQNQYLSDVYLTKFKKIHTEPFNKNSVGYPRTTVSALLPGKILRDEFLFKRKMSVTDLSQLLKVKKSAMKHISTGHYRINAEWAFKLGQALDTDPMYWLELQMNYDFNELIKLEG